jgi:hypothetical protein
MLTGRAVESYAVIRDRDYMKVIRKECKILSEKKKLRRHALIANAATWVGSLMRCPDCGAWLLMTPQRGPGGSKTVLLEAAHRSQPPR